MGASDLFAELGNVQRSADSSTNDSVTVKAPADPPLSPELTKAIYFTRRFVLTYYIVVVFVVLAASIIYQKEKHTRRVKLQKPTKAETPSTQSSSSASSTLYEDGTAVSKSGSINERTGLLRTSNPSQSNFSFAARASARLKSFLTYQPRPIPALTAPSNYLPSNAVSLLVVILIVVNLFYLLFNLKTPVAAAFLFAHRAGLLFVVNLPVLYVLGAKNNQPLKWLTGWSYEKLNIFHRRLGEWMVTLGVLHGVGMFVTWYTIMRPVSPFFSLRWFLTLPIIILGNAALASFLIIWVTSIGQFRAKAYELFLAAHVSFQIAALVLLFFHQSESRPYCGAALGIWALDRIVGRILRSNARFIATLEIAKDETTVLLYCDVKLDPSKIGNIRSGWKAGQHVFLTVPGMSWSHALQAHPFTIGSPAPSLCAKGMIWPMQLIIRSMDGFSKELLEHAKFHQHVEVSIDGPYGSSELEDQVASAQRVCLIAGGSGITVTYPLAWTLLAQEHGASIISNRTMYENGKKRKTEVLLRPDSSEQRISHFWIRQNNSHGSWITMFPADHSHSLISAASSNDSYGVDLVSRTFNTRETGHTARPDIATEFRNWLARGDSIFDQNQRVCVVVSGPDGLVRDVRNCIATMIRAGYNIDLHTEKFGW